jgi:hypothetical protein
MKYNRLFLTTIIVALSASIKAQDSTHQAVNSVNILNEGYKYWFGYETPVKDEKTGLNTVKWRNTENKHKKGRDDKWAESVITTDHTLRTQLGADTYIGEDRQLVPLSWVLTEENNETVLHCYLKMPADAIKNFWLASDETAIVDAETGVQYRARRSEPENWEQYFCFRASKDELVDFRIYFPPLRPETRKVYIYGVPNWGLNGDQKYAINRTDHDRATMMTYDKAPQFHKPQMIRQANNYNKDNSESWAEYTDVHLIKPLKHDAMALWLTPDATYLAIAHEQNWTREYFCEGPNDFLFDYNGHVFKLKEVQDYPNGNIFWVRGNTGDWIAFVKVYEPLTPDVETINYIVPEGEPFKAWGANWSGTTISNLSVDELRKNQSLFEYHPRVVVK